jgi:hypothetical protein
MEQEGRAAGAAEESVTSRGSVSKAGVGEVVVIPVPAGKQSFRGSLIDQVSSRIDETDVRQERFTVIRMFRVTDDTLPNYQYVISTIGRSVRYHVHNSRCNLGVPVTPVWLEALDYFEDLTECRICKPPAIEDLSDSDQVDYEMDRINPVRWCESPADAVTKLHERRKVVVMDPDTGLKHEETELYLSAPAERLLYRVAALDEGIGAHVREVRPKQGAA